ncbi:hypothetical protein AAZV13_06G180400 [Glycine max]
MEPVLPVWLQVITLTKKPSTSTCFLWCSMALGYFLCSILVKFMNCATKNITTSGGWLARNNININHLNLFYLFLSIYIELHHVMS